MNCLVEKLRNLGVILKIIQNALIGFIINPIINYILYTVGTHRIENNKIKTKKIILAIDKRVYAI